MKKIANIAYHCGKIVEGVHDYGDETYRQFGIGNVHHVEQQLAGMLRDIQASPERKETRDLQMRLRFHFNPINHALRFLGEFLESKDHTEEDQLTAIVFADYICNEVPKIVREFGYEETPPTW